MADQSLGKDDCLDDSDEGVYEQGDGSTLHEDEILSPIQRVTKYARSEHTYNRQCVSGVILELFKMAPADALTPDLPEIMEILNKLAIDDENMIRVDVLDHIPNLAAMAINQSRRVPALANITSEHLLSMVVNNLGDSDNSVRRNAHRALIALLERNLVNKLQAEIQVCPNILALTKKASAAIDGITLMAKVVPLLGRDITERVFLDRYADLCMDSQIYIRTCCVSHIGDFCATVSQPLFEKVLFPSYSKLCSDEAWGVRKACAEIAMSVSCACTPEIRRNELAPIFGRFLQDKCRWVRISAYETLGPFITTFAEPSITSLAYNNNGELVLISYGSEFKINSSPCTDALELKMKHVRYITLTDLADELGLAFNDDDDEDNPPDQILPPKSPQQPQGIPQAIPTYYCNSEELIESLDYEVSYMPRVKRKQKNVNEESDTNCDNQSSDTNSTPVTRDVASSATSDNADGLENVDLSHGEQSTCNESKCADSGGTNATPEGNNEESLELYNSHNYWYVPPDMPLDPNIVAGLEPEKTAVSDKINIFYDVKKTDAFCDFEKNENSKLNETVVIESSLADTTYDADAEPADDTLEGESSTVTEETKEPPQKIVPQVLIDHFIAMADIKTAKTIHDKIAYHCAYSLPAVALTLGSSNSHLLKETVESLSNHMHYKVRLTLASCLHELALIWGSEIASNDLTPVFLDLLRDLDEVRSGVLKNLVHFLTLLEPTKRSLYLPRLGYFLQNNHKLNWRFRYELAEQLHLSVGLFTPVESKQLAYIAQRLLCDKVDAVRQMSLKLVAKILRHVNSEPGMSSRFLIKLAETFAHSKKWKLRQTFVFLSEEVLVTKALPIDQFACDVLPHLLDLSWDPVANVRLVVARTLATHLINNEYFQDPENQQYDSLDSALRRLQTDKDTDVRQYAMPECYSVSANIY